MLYRKLGDAGLRTSNLGFGCMRFPVLNGQADQIDEEKAQVMVDYAIAHGVNYFDTAYVYHSKSFPQGGTSEVFLGRALKAHRQKVLIATKLPSWFIETRADMDRYLDEQLERLQTDHIDCYLVHSLSGELWKKLKGLGIGKFLDEAKADGRIRQAGFSFHDDSEQFKPIVDGYPWAFCQIQYNFMDEDFQAGRAGLHYAAGKGLGVVVMEPLRGGGLTNNVPPEVQAVWAQAQVKRTPAEWALRFVWNRPEISTVLSGMSDMAQLQENVRIASEVNAETLTPEELTLIRQVRAVYQARTRVKCTSCGYCMPCPEGVDIPANFLQLNNLAIYRNPDAAKWFYLNILSEEQRASHCTECGRCVELCPQQIPIPERLKEVAQELEPR